MPRSLGAFLLFFSLFSSSSIAQQGGGQSSATEIPARVGSDAMIVDLLQQSHDLDKQAPLRLQPFLLRMQAGQVAELRPDLAREWANELFQLASQQKGQEAPAHRVLQCRFWCGWIPIERSNCYMRWRQAMPRPAAIWK